MNGEIKVYYYTVSIDLQDIDGVKETTGWKTLNVYHIVDDKPLRVCEITCSIENNPTEEIEMWFENNEDVDTFTLEEI